MIVLRIDKFIKIKRFQVCVCDVLLDTLLIILV